jgi:hypothetical protein
MVEENLDEEHRYDWCDNDFLNDESYSQDVIITPEAVAVLSLIDCRDQLTSSVAHPRKLLLAAKAAHLSLQSALTAALAGSANIGAHPEKLRIEYLQFLNQDMNYLTKYPKSDRVMYFYDLLKAARNAPLPWTNQKIAISDDEEKLLIRLTEIRHAIEHAKQTHHSVQKCYILEAIGPAIELTNKLLHSVYHHFEETEMLEIEAISQEVLLLLNSIRGSDPK